MKNSIGFFLNNYLGWALSPYDFTLTMYQPPLLLCLLWTNHIHCLSTSPPLFFYFYVWTFLFVVPNSLISKILYFSLLYCLLSPHFYFLPYSTLHHLTCYHLKFILGNWFSLHLLLLIPAVIDQVSEPLTALTYLSAPSF